MSEFSFDPKSSNVSPFRRLVSGRVAKSPDGPGNAPPDGGKPLGVFNAIRAAPSGGGEAEVRIAPLEAAVTNINRSATTLEQVAGAGAEIAGSNAEASRATVRDVDAAADLARDLRSRITANGSVASDAQVSGISPDVVERILN